MAVRSTTSVDTEPLLALVESGRQQLENFYATMESFGHLLKSTAEKENTLSAAIVANAESSQRLADEFAFHMDTMKLTAESLSKHMEDLAELVASRAS